MKKILLPILLLVFSLNLIAQDLSGVRIYINPGHGGYDANDRNVVIPPFKSGDPNGFWESSSNLHKGLYLKEMLDSHGASTAISRVTNTTEDDLPLSQIVRSGNEFNADLLLSIHSNAGGLANHILMLYAGRDLNDTKIYPTQPSPEVERKSRAISEVIAKNLYMNKLTPWAHPYALRGDKTAASQWFGWSDGYGVLRGVTVPTVLSEGSMHDYIPETYRLMNMDYKYLEAWNFFKSIADYFKSETIPHGIIAGSVRDKFIENPAPYKKISNSHDLFKPINGATVKLIEKDLTYTTDTLNNGIYVFKNLEPGEYTLEVSAKGYHSRTFKMTVEANTISYDDTRINLIRNTPPEVVEYSPHALTSDTVMLASSTIKFKFNWDVDAESAKQAFSISPAVEGKFEFKESNFVMEFIPNEPLDISTVYTVVLDKTLKHFDGLSMEEDFTFQFKTTDRNRLRLLASYPLDNETNVDYKKPTFTFVFDKELMTAELIDGVQVYDMDGNMLKKNRRSLLHNKVPAPMGSTSFMLGEDLVPGKQYYVSIAKGIKDIDGVFLTDTLLFSFTASDERITDKTVVETYETSDKLSYDEAQSVNVTKASVTRSSAKKLFGSYSNNLKYTFSSSEGGSVVYKIVDSVFEATNDSTVGLHIYGDMSGNEMYLLFESETDTKEVLLDSIHYGGWKFAEADLSVLLPKTTYRLTGYKLVQRSAPLSESGSIFIDNLLLYGEPITSVISHKLEDVTIYPNPAKDIIRVSKSPHQIVEEMQLYALNGKLIRSSEYDYLLVDDIPVGTYLLKIRFNEGVYSTPVIVRR